jgi:hypothetical protein
VATGTGGTNAASSLTSLLVSRAMAEADVASINALIKGDSGPSTAPIGAGYIMGGSWNHSGILYVPGRGVLIAQPGDYVMVDAVAGWPILVSANAIAIGSSVWTS